jgi:hypothetical protein
MPDTTCCAHRARDIDTACLDTGTRFACPTCGRSWTLSAAVGGREWRSVVQEISLVDGFLSAIDAQAPALSEEEATS